MGPLFFFSLSPADLFIYSEFFPERRKGRLN